MSFSLSLSLAAIDRDISITGNEVSDSASKLFAFPLLLAPLSVPPPYEYFGPALENGEHDNDNGPMGRKLSDSSRICRNGGNEETRRARNSQQQRGKETSILWPPR